MPDTVERDAEEEITLVTIKRFSEVQYNCK